MKYLPLLFDIKGRRCLIVGGGSVGSRRARIIASAGGIIDLISRDVSEDTATLIRQTGGDVKQRSWEDADVDDSYALVVAATDDEQVNRDIRQVCQSRKVPVNVVTDSAISDIAFPSIIDRDPITVAVSSGSASPILAKSLGKRIDALIPAGYGNLATLVGKYRAKAKSVFRHSHQRKQFWEKVLLGPAAEYVFSGNPEYAEKIIQENLENPQDTPDVGEAYLIGAGPGDPDLLTFKAYRLLQQSDVVLYDRLVSDRILSGISDHAEMVYVGKKRSDHSVPQQNINQMLVDYALAGKRVARLKGGDPFIFGRGGEEIALLAEHRIPFQVVPGVTAASGCACYAGIPLTHRDYAQSVRFVTGQLQDGTVDLPWGQLVAPDQTVVIYMGLSGLPTIAENLVAHGMNPTMPAALVEQGTTVDQRVISATISTLPELVGKLKVKAPTLLIIGEVVNLHHSLAWYESGREMVGDDAEES